MSTKFEVKTLTPVHIGSGNKYLAADFVVAGNKVIFIDPVKFFEEIGAKGYDLVDVAREVAEGKSVSDFVEDISRLKIREVPFTGSRKRNEILEHVKSGGELFIPGSTIKGAIRTVLLWKAIKENRSLLNWTVEHVKRTIGNRGLSKRELTRLDDELENKVFRRAKLTEKPDDPKNDLLRALRVADSTPFKKRRIYEIKFLGMGNFSQLVECIDFNDSAEIDLNIDNYVLGLLGQQLDFELITEAANEFAKAVVETEVGREYPEKAKNEFRSVLRSKGLVLRVGWGIGWYSTTLGTLLKTHPEFETLRKRLGLGKHPRSNRFSRNFPMIRRVTYDDRPLGWIEIGLK